LSFNQFWRFAMNTHKYGLHAVALAIVVVGALWLGLPLNTLAVLGLVLVCPLMMLFMMRGTHGGEGHDQRRTR
jgi:hypothetical protein